MTSIDDDDDNSVVQNKLESRINRSSSLIICLARQTGFDHKNEPK